MPYHTSTAGIEPTFNPTASGRMDMYYIAVLVVPPTLWPTKSVNFLQVMSGAN